MIAVIAVIAVKNIRVTVEGPVKKPQMDYMSHRGITHTRRGPRCTRRDKKRCCINSSQCTTAKVAAGLDMVAALGVVLVAVEDGPCKKRYDAPPVQSMGKSSGLCGLRVGSPALLCATLPCHNQEKEIKERKGKKKGKERKEEETSNKRRCQASSNTGACAKACSGVGDGSRRPANPFAWARLRRLCSVASCRKKDTGGGGGGGATAASNREGHGPRPRGHQGLRQSAADDGRGSRCPGVRKGAGGHQRSVPRRSTSPGTASPAGRRRHGEIPPP